MTKEKYVESPIYKNSIKLIIDFTNTILGGDIMRLKSYCFDELSRLEKEDYMKYAEPNGLIRGKQKNIRWRFDPDDTALARACYCVLWGDLFDIGVKEDHFIGSRTKDQSITARYRGDTMNSFNTVFGKMHMQGIPTKIQMYELDKNCCVLKQVMTFYHTYHTIGNMILLPNAGHGRMSDGINNIRGNFALKDYFDYFLMNLYEYKYPEKVKFNSRVINRGKTVRELMNLKDNSDYKKIDIKTWRERFFLEDYFEEDIPKNIIDIEIDRFKITRFPRKRSNDYSKEEYLELATSYLENCTKLICGRSEKLVKSIEEEILQYCRRIGC